jgi:anthranilate synthase/aminodeoxychorismate synthase-like glutamine amidotransferase
VLLFIDNYDSFTYILVDYFKQLQLDILIKRNDEITIDEIKLLQPQAIVLGPGPNTPKDSGLMMQIINEFYLQLPMLGICLGHQAIGEFFNCKLLKAKEPRHGKTSMLIHTQHQLFKNLPSQFNVMRYHSLIVENINENELEIIATTKANEVMAIAHKKLPIIGFQFHPESILTEYGIELLNNWKQLYL